MSLGDDLALIAGALSSQPGEASRRSAVNRYYYAAFTKLRQEVFSFLPNAERDRMQRILPEVLWSANVATSVQVARDLNAIRAKRNDADYDLIRFAAGDAAVVAALYVSLVSKMKALTSQKAQDALAKTWRSMSSEPPRRS